MATIFRSIRNLPIALLLLTVACDSSQPSTDPANQVGLPSPAIGGGSGTNAGAAGALAGTPGPTAGQSSPIPSAIAGMGGATAVGQAGAAENTIAGTGGTAAAGIGGAGGSSGATAGGSSGATAGGSSGATAGGSSGATAGASGASGEGGGAAGGGSSTPRPKCKTNPSQVIVIGDSYLNWITHTFPDDLVREAGETWRMYAAGGCSLGSGGLCLVPDQFDQALRDDPDIIATVMSGGGNDILIADEFMFPGATACKDRADSPMVKACQDIVAAAISAGQTLMNKAADAGIRDVIYMFYPHIPGGGFGGLNPNVLLDYALPKAKALCDEAEQRTEHKLRCHFIDLVPVFDGHPDWFADDGIHENSVGSAAIAKEVVKVAKDNCVAQPASSGCCEP